MGRYQLVGTSSGGAPALLLIDTMNGETWYSGAPWRHGTSGTWRQHIPPLVTANKEVGRYMGASAKGGDHVFLVDRHRRWQCIPRDRPSLGTGY